MRANAAKAFVRGTKPNRFTSFYVLFCVNMN